MPKSSEFDMGANSIVVHFPLANDASSTADEVIYSSWYDIDSNFICLLNYDAE